MRSYWTQPSLSRDFALLSAAVFFVLFLVSAWVTYTTYNRHSERIASELKIESERVERTLASEMNAANYMLNSLGRQIVLDDKHDLTKLAQMLKAFDSKGYIYAIFNFVSVDQKVIVSSNKGVLDKPVDISDRDFVKKAFVDPWKMHIGRPIEGRVSGRWVIPVALGLTDYTGKFIGTIMISIDINALTERISSLVKRDGISFAIISKTLIPLTQVSEDKDFLADNFPAQRLANLDFTTNPSGLIAQGNMLWGTGNYSYYSVSQEYPYIILMGYDDHNQDDTIRATLWSRILQMIVIAAFFLLFMLIVRTRMISPITEITDIISEVARGNTHREIPSSGSVEISALSGQVKRVSEYINENKRIEDELRNKMFMLKRAKQELEIEKRSKAEFFAYVCQEMRTPLNNVVGYSQVMKEQLYGPIENRKYRQYTQDIYTSCNNMMSYLDDVLSLSRLDADYVEMKEQLVDITDVINKAQRAVSDKLQDNKITVKTTLPDDSIMLVADGFRLQQMLMNLMVYFTMHESLPANLFITLRIANDKTDKQCAMLCVSTAELTHAQFEALIQTTAFHDTGNIHLELAQRLAGIHQAPLKMIESGKTIAIAAIIPGTRIRFND